MPDLHFFRKENCRKVSRNHKIACARRNLAETFLQKSVEMRQEEVVGFGQKIDF